MSASQQSKQLELNLSVPPSASPGSRDRSSEAFIAARLSESPTGEIRLMESILEWDNVRRALKRVRSNKGAPGVDGMTVAQLPGYLRRHWPKIHDDLLHGRYVPLPVRRKTIPKPDGGERLLGIPAVLDRLVQQAVAQVLQVMWDPTFSESSFGFRPGRSPHQAIRQARDFVRYADDFVIHVKSKRAGERVMESVKRYVTRTLGLKVNEESRPQGDRLPSAAATKRSAVATVPWDDHGAASSSAFASPTRGPLPRSGFTGKASSVSGSGWLKSPAAHAVAV